MKDRCPCGCATLAVSRTAVRVGDDGLLERVVEVAAATGRETWLDWRVLRMAPATADRPGLDAVDVGCARCGAPAASPELEWDLHDLASVGVDEGLDGVLVPSEARGRVPSPAHVTFHSEAEAA